MKRWISVLAMAALVAAAPTALAQEDDEDQVILRVGLTQNWDNLNPIVGWLVSEWETWNIHYATVTDIAADDFSTIPGLAESWVESDDGLTVTYTLREGLLWSDGEPLTADDVAWNINTSRDEGWENMWTTTANLDATAVDDRTVEVTSSVPDPKLPGLPLYILPRHIWERVAAEGDITAYDGLDGVGSGPFVISELRDQQSLTMVANPNYYGWEGEEPVVDQLIFRHFSNADAMVAALQRGEIDAAHGIPSGSVATLEEDPNIEVVAGELGGFDEIGLNAGDGAAPPHPALLDLEVRKAISFGVDREAVIEDLLFGFGSATDTISPSADAKWMPEIPEANRFTYDPDRAIELLEAAGYADTDGDGIREMPDGTPIVLRHGVNTTSQFGTSIAELFTGWMADIGIGVELLPYDDGQLGTALIDGDYDTFYWGWTPFVDPDPMLSYFTTAEIGNWNDANWSNERYDELYTAQNQELDPDRRQEMVHEMLTIFHDDAVYIPLYLSPDLQAYRTDTFEGWVRHPSETGTVMFGNSSPSYAAVQPIGGDGGSAGIATLPLILGGVAAVVVLGGILVISRRRSSADDRE